MRVKQLKKNTIINNDLDLVTLRSLDRGICSIDLVTRSKTPFFVRGTLQEWGTLNADKQFPRIRRGSF